MKEHFDKVLAEDAFPESGIAAAVIKGWHVLICRIGGDYHAMNNRCSHAASPLASGRVRQNQIMCPLHGARFELKSGKCVGGASRDIRTFPVKVEAGSIWVQVPDQPPTIDEVPVTPA